MNRKDNRKFSFTGSKITSSDFYFSLEYLVRLWVLLFIMLASIVPISCTPEKDELWYCPMHPNFTAPRKTSCPICGMDLVKQGEEDNYNDENYHGDHLTHKDQDINDAQSKDIVEDVARENESRENVEKSDGDENISNYADQKEKPSNVSQSEKANRESEKLLLANHQDHQFDPVELPYVRVAPSIQAAIGLRLYKVVKMDLEKTIISYGLVAFDPELYQAAIEYRQALQTARVMAGGRSLAESARFRLKILGLSEHEIEKIKNFNLEKIIVGGRQGKAILYSSAYEMDLGDLQIGLKVSATLDAFPGEKFYGKIIGIGSVVDMASRSVRIRSELEDPKNRLRPQMFATVSIHVEYGEIIAVPETSFVDTGRRKVAYRFLAGSEDKIAPVVIRTGKSGNGFFQVLSGLKEEDVIVDNAIFLIDSESKMRNPTHQH